MAAHLPASMHVYFDKRVLSIFLLGISQGFPWVMIGSALTIWLKEGGVSRTEIGYAGLIFLVYAINFLWSPLVDQCSIPGLRKLGRRKSWILLCQLAVAGACVAMSLFDASQQANTLVLAALVLAISSSTQDIAIDAYRIDHFAATENQYISAGAAAATAGWWTGYAGLGYLPLRLSDTAWTWPALYLLMACIMLGIAAITFFVPHPSHSLSVANIQKRLQTAGKRIESVPGVRKILLLATIILPFPLAIWLILGSPGVSGLVSEHVLYLPLWVIALVLTVSTIRLQLNRMASVPQLAQNRSSHPTLNLITAHVLQALIEPLQDFFRRNGLKLALSLLAFVLLFKIGEAFLGRMSVVFYKEIGYSNTDIANYSKILTWWLTIIFALLGGLVNVRFGLIRGLFISGCAMAASNLMFSWIALVGPDINLYIATVIVDGFAQAWSTVAFVSFISFLCSHNFSATQYALLASLGSLGRNLIASSSGAMVDWLDGNWALFFAITTIMVTPGLILLLSIKGSVTEREQADKAP